MSALTLILAGLAILAVGAWWREYVARNALERRFVRLWEMGCCCGVITPQDGKDWDALQAIGQQLNEKWATAPEAST